MNYQTIALTHSGMVATIWLNRAEIRNAFNEVAITEITHAFRALDMEREVRVIVLAAKGTAFCAGADLNWMKKMSGYSDAENLADAAALADMMHAIYTCTKPTVARQTSMCFHWAKAA